jgi:cation transport protein ChaC
VALWVFGYGSLIWNPGFDPAERLLAELPGFARSFCMRSIHHRGTPERPGLVLALDADPGAVCTGVAFRVRDGEEAAVTLYLRERELISSAYLEQHHPLRLSDGRQVEARCFVVDRHHVQYCGGLALEEQAGIIAHAVGGRGENHDYLSQTARHLAGLGLHDADLEWLDSRVADLRHASGAL